MSAPARFSLFTFSRSVAAAAIVTSGLSCLAVRMESASSASLFVAATTARASPTFARSSASSSDGSAVSTCTPSRSASTRATDSSGVTTRNGTFASISSSMSGSVSSP